MQKNFKLNNNQQIPSIGFGTWKIADGEQSISSIKTAVENGFRHIDGAAIYRNEKGVGAGIKACGIDRKKLFVTSKLWHSERGFDATIKGFEKTLADLQLDYLDLYLIHWPATAHQFDNWQELNSETWRAMEQLHSEGKIKNIGVSNFLKHHLKPLMANAKIMPSVNQLEYHPGFMQSESVQFCQENNIQVTGWSPLGRGGVLEDNSLQKIADKHQKSVAQLCIRWALQNKVIPLPKSITPARIKENFDVYDFEISVEDMEAINQMEFGNSGINPDTRTF